MNAVLMVILFVGAIKHPDEKSTKNESHIILENEKEQENQNSLDSIDRLLDEYVIKKENEKNQAEVIVKKEIIEPAVVASEIKEEKPIQTQTEEVKVVSGDSLDKLARRYKTSVQEIMRVNNLTTSTLQIGQILYINKPSVQGSRADEKRYYVVKSGESPWTIASKNKLRLDELLKLNHLNEASAKKLKPGDRLRIQ